MSILLLSCGIRGEHLIQSVKQSVILDRPEDCSRRLWNFHHTVRERNRHFHILVQGDNEPGFVSQRAQHSSTVIPVFEWICLANSFSAITTS